VVALFLCSPPRAGSIDLPRVFPWGSLGGSSAVITIAPGAAWPRGRRMDARWNTPVCLGSAAVPREGPTAPIPR
jgi:hypothetical protein